MLLSPGYFLLLTFVEEKEKRFFQRHDTALQPCLVAKGLIANTTVTFNRIE